MKRDKNSDFNISSSNKVSLAHSDEEDFVNQKGQWETTVHSRITPLGELLYFLNFCMGAFLKGSYWRRGLKKFPGS